MLLLFIGSAVAFWYYLPTLLVKAVSGDAVIKVIPAKVQETINKEMNEVPKILDELHKEGVDISFDDIIAAIDNAKVSEITATMDELERANLKNKEQFINIVLQNMDFGKLENEKMIAIANEKIKMSDIKKLMKMARENGKPYALTIPLAKETLKGLLLEKKKQVEEKLNS